MFDRAIKGEAVFADRIQKACIFVKGDKIERILSQEALEGTRGEVLLSQCKEVLDFDSNYLLFPSAIDAQVHSRSQKGAEGFTLASLQALSAGVGTLVEMPYDEGLLVSNAKNLEAKKQEGLAQSLVDFALYATIDPSEGTEKIEELIASGCCGFKFSTFGTDPKRFPRIPPYLLQESFSKIAPSGLVCGVHNEDDESVRHLVEKVKSERTDYLAHGLSRPPWSENIATALVYELGVDTGARAHIVHASNARAYELAKAYRSQGYHADIECCLHYLVFCEEGLEKLGGKAKVNPPIRSRFHREALWDYLKSGDITCVSTDHVSWSLDRKTKPNIFENSSGMSGLDLLLPLLLTEASRRGVDLRIIARVLAYNPARLFSLSHRKGALEAGRDADLVVLRKQKHTYSSQSSLGRLAFSAYEGRELDFKVAKHFIRGQLVFDEGQVLVKPGFGDFISPLSPGAAVDSMASSAACRGKKKAIS